MLTLLELLVLDFEGTKLLHKSHLFAFGESCGQIVDLKMKMDIIVKHDKQFPNVKKSIRKILTQIRTLS